MKQSPIAYFNQIRSQTLYILNSILEKNQKKNNPSTPQNLVLIASYKELH